MFIGFKVLRKFESEVQRGHFHDFIGRVSGKHADDNWRWTITYEPQHGSIVQDTEELELEALLIGIQRYNAFERQVFQ